MKSSSCFKGRKFSFWRLVLFLTFLCDLGRNPQTEEAGNTRMHNAEGAEGGGGGKEGREFMGVSLSLSLPSYSRSGKWWERETGGGEAFLVLRKKQNVSPMWESEPPPKMHSSLPLFPDTALYLFVPNIYVYIACRHGGERYARRQNVQC